MVSAISLDEQLDRTGRPRGQCWIWQGALSGQGRAMFRGRSAGRSVWEKFKGPFDEKLYVLHRCDNPRCVNPAHLFLGDQAANMADMCAKGRQKKDGQPPGENHAMAKLTESQALEIVRRCRAGEHYAVACRDYPVSAERARRIVTGKRWKHLQEAA